MGEGEGCAEVCTVLGEGDGGRSGLKVLQRGDGIVKLQQIAYMCKCVTM